MDHNFVRLVGLFDIQEDKWMLSGLLPSQMSRFDTHKDTTLLKLQLPGYLC